MSLSKTTRQRIAKLQKAYIDSMPEKHAEVTTQWMLAEQDHWQGKAVKKLSEVIHFLTGSGAAYGFPDISATAYEIECCLRSNLTDRDNIEDLNRYLRVLCGLLTVYAHDEREQKPELVAESWISSHTSEHIFILAKQSQEIIHLIQRLESANYTVSLFNNLNKLEQRIAQEKPSAIIFDIQTSDVSDNLLQLKSLLRAYLSDDIPWIFISDHDDFALRLQIVKASGAAFLVKPITTQQLLLCLENVLMLNMKQPYRVLLLEYDYDMSSLYQAALEQASMLLHLVHQPEELIAALVEFQPEIILMDISFTGCDGLELATLIRQEDAYLHTPIIFLTNSPYPEKRIADFLPERRLAALGIGNHDYLSKSIPLEQLTQIISARIRYSRRVNKLIAYDGLTGLLNQQGFSARLGASIANAERSGSPIALAMIEIDNFCQLNKQYDYWLGNALIKYIAKMLRNRFRRGDLIGRYHGHRFIIALNDADVDSAAHVLRQLSQEMVTTPIELNQLVLHITLSIGIAHYPGHIHFGTESNHDHLINTTEKAVTEAIQQGGNQVIIKPIADIMNSNY